MFWVVQITTFAILILAANTSFQGFPRLAALLAHDRFFPRQFGNLGDRLVFSNGIIVLSGARGLPALGLQRRRRLAYPPLRDRRLHRLHALAGRNGAVLAMRGGPGLEAKRQRSMPSAPSRHRRRDCDRRPDEVHTGCLARDHRDPAARRSRSSGSTATTAGRRAGSEPAPPRSKPRRRPCRQP